MNITDWQKYIIYIIDLAVVLYAFYRFISFIRGTKAINIFWGLLIIALFTLIANRLNLPLTSWLLKQFWLAGIIVLAIVFQPELRNVLSELPLRRRKIISIVAIEEIISAVRELAQNKHGALIVIERNVGLKEYTKTGVILNADVTKELLLSIFYPKSSLHDGAVIISKDKIFAAKCILPLSEEKYCENYGTRHRAGAGIAQSSDAIAIIVSEEKGTISLAVNKEFYYDIQIEKLRELLSKYLRNITF
ncbi:MAG: diadenylate cyclase CdaA [Endomicrobia bacterium]|nr:diadenylate cyclase CdaA [Endomicrobiia bacterium]MDW8055749.1 diadenylate cyclase CdaA [Elusimicrobiota bacterium]